MNKDQEDMLDELSKLTLRWADEEKDPTTVTAVLLTGASKIAAATTRPISP